MTPTQADALIRAEMGEGYQTVKLSGYWLIYTPKNADGHRTLLVQHRGALPRAIAQAKALV